MNKSKAKSNKKGARRIAGKGRAQSKRVDMHELREEISQRVGSEAVRMVETTIAEADKGHYGAMKYLFEMIGLYPAGTQEEAPQDEDSLARTLLQRIGLPEEQAKGADPNNASQPSSPEDPQAAVK